MEAASKINLWWNEIKGERFDPRWWWKVRQPWTLCQIWFLFHHGTKCKQDHWHPDGSGILNKNNFVLKNYISIYLYVISSVFTILIFIKLSYTEFLYILQKNEVTSSNAMELEGLKRSLKCLEDSKLEIKTIVTDRHPSIQKFLRLSKKHVKHEYDTWHVAKGR